MCDTSSVIAAMAEKQVKCSPMTSSAGVRSRGSHYQDGGKLGIPVQASQTA